MIKQEWQKLKLRFTSADHARQIISNLNKSDKVRNVRIDGDYVKYEQATFIQNEVNEDSGILSVLSEKLGVTLKQRDYSKLIPETIERQNKISAKRFEQSGVRGEINEAEAMERFYRIGNRVD